MGNRILIDKDGNPVLDKYGKPVIIPKEMLDACGASLGKPEAVNIDKSQAEKLNVLANMVKGLSEEDAKKQYFTDMFKNQMNHYLENIQIKIDDEEGPIPGTKNKGLNTIELPKELQDAGSYDPTKI